MEILKNDNWKYEISFNNTLYMEVKRFSFNLPEEQKEQMNFEIDFYRTFYSFQQVLDSLKKIRNEENLEKFKNAVEKRKANILYCPNQLLDYYKDLVDTSFKAHRGFLFNLLKYANTQGIIINPSKLYLNIFGKKIHKIVKKKCFKYCKKFPNKFHNPIVKKGGVKCFIENKVKEIEKDKLAQNLWGRFRVGNFAIVEKLGFGIGKWNDRNFSYLDNKFTVQTNSNLITEKELELSINSNIYPGNAHLFNTLYYENRKISVDTSATFLINGWSMFSAWHYKPDNFSRANKYNFCKVIKNLYDKNYNQESINRAYNALLNITNKQNAIQYLIQLTQYLGLFESYSLGAIAVEYLVDKYNKGAKNFLTFLSKNNIGNYFDDYLKKIKESE